MMYFRKYYYRLQLGNVSAKLTVKLFFYVCVGYRSPRSDAEMNRYPLNGVDLEAKKKSENGAYCQSSLSLEIETGRLYTSLSFSLHLKKVAHCRTFSLKSQLMTNQHNTVGRCFA